MCTCTHWTRKQTSSHVCLCANAVEKRRSVFWCLGRGGFLNFWQFLFGSLLKPATLHFVSASSLFPFYRRRFCRQLSFYPSPLSLSLSHIHSVCLLSLTLDLASILSAGCRGAVLGFSPPVPVETMRVRLHNIEQSFISGSEGRDACGEGKQNVRQLLNVAGAAPCWVDFASVVIEDNWEQSPRGTFALSARICMRAIYVAARGRPYVCACTCGTGRTRPYDSHTHL